MRMTAMLRILTLGAIACAVTAASPPPGPQQLGAAVRTGAAPNHAFVVDASAGHHVLQIPQAPREFASFDAFIRYAMTAYNGTALYDRNHKLAGAAGVAVIRGRAVTVDAKMHRIVEQPDPILAQIGGATRTLKIAGRTYDLTRKVADRRMLAARRRGGPVLLAQSSPPGEVDQCNRGACAKSTSFFTSALIYQAVGSETQQTSGGFQQSSYFCWKDGFIPWSCTKSSGSNTFFIANEYFDFAAPIQLGQTTATANNVSSLTLEQWAVGVPGSLGVVGNATGVCGVHSGTGVAPSGAKTGAGKHGSC